MDAGAGGGLCRSGDESTISCQAQGFVVESYGDHVPYQVWTPDTGWQAPPPGLAELGLRSLLVSSTYNGYLASGAGVERVDLVEGVTATPLDAGGLGERLPTESVDIVDDAGRLLVACGEQVDDRAECVVVQDG